VQLRRHLWPAFSHRLVERSCLRPPRPVLCRCFPHRESSVAAGADTPAWADSVDISVTNKAELGKGYPQVHVNIQEPIAGFKLKLKRSDGKVQEWKGGGPPGTTRNLDLEQPEGKFSYEGELSVNNKNGSTGSMPLVFDAELWGPLHLKLDKKDVDVAGRKIAFSLSRPISKVELKVLLDSGRPAFDGEIKFNAEPGGTRLDVTWPEASGNVFKIAFRAFDTTGFHTGIDLFPWSINIPHEEVNFDSGKSDIRPGEETKLDKSVKEISDAVFKYGRFAEVKLYVAGHTDTVGSKESNRALSNDRARSIASYFKKKGIKCPIRYFGFGEEALMVGTNDEVDEQRNRRAEYILSVEDPAGKQTPVVPKWQKL
jgi:outer membrane protein OmpA-like peptidoglycan-associated protein